MDLQQSHNELSEPLIQDDTTTTTAQAAADAPAKPAQSRPAESYHGKASPLSTGMLFTNPKGIVDSIPDPSKPCLLFSDWCPVGECAYISLLEKEWQHYTANGGYENTFVLRKDRKLFTTVQVCEALAKHGDPGSRLLKKLKGIKGGNYKSVPNSPVLVHDGNIIIELCLNDVKSLGGNGLLGLLLPGHIDEAIGDKNSLRPGDAIGLYNMNLFIRRHSNLPNLVNELIICQSHSQRVKISTDLLALLKTIDADLQKFEGPYLCGDQFTLADICIFPFMERIVLVLSNYRGFFIPPSLTHLVSWYETVLARPSIRIATADRDEVSINTYCYEQVGRKQYLLEVYECQIRGEVGMFKELNDRAGQIGVNVYREALEEDDSDRRVCEVKACHKLQQCVIS